MCRLIGVETEQLPSLDPPTYNICMLSIGSAERKFLSKNLSIGRNVQQRRDFDGAADSWRIRMFAVSDRSRDVKHLSGGQSIGGAESVGLDNGLRVYIAIFASQRVYRIACNYSYSSRMWAQSACAGEWLTVLWQPNRCACEDNGGHLEPIQAQDFIRVQVIATGDAVHMFACVQTVAGGND